MTKPVNRPHLPKGRKPLQPPAKAADTIRQLSADGHSQIGIAQQLGVSVKTLFRWFDETPELKDAFDQGRERERHTLHNMLYKQAIDDGNATAAMFILNSKFGYRQGDQGETANRVSINFTLPGALPLADFIDVTPTNRKETTS